MDVKDWVIQNFSGCQEPVLVQITIPANERDKGLRELNRMKINHLTLFPDLEGAALYTNTAMEIENYDPES